MKSSSKVVSVELTTLIVVTVSSVVWGQNSSIEYTAFANAGEITEAEASETKIYVLIDPNNLKVRYIGITC